MANNLNGVVAKFTTRLDRVVEAETVTNDLSINGDLIGEVTNTGEAKIAKLDMQGLANYNRASGFSAGDVTLEWETVKLEYDRGREFTIDAIDDEEHMLVVSANVMSEFARTKVVPEVDATRFARLDAAAGGKATGELTTPEGALDAVLAAEEHMEDAGVALSECILYVSPAVKTLLRKAQSWRITNGDGAVSTDIQLFDGMKMRTVPSSRFFTKVDLKNDVAGGFAKATGGFAVNFQVVHPSACQAIQKHEKLRYFAPDVNQAADAHKWQYRLHHDLLVLENRKGLIYSHNTGK